MKSRSWEVGEGVAYWMNSVGLFSTMFWVWFPSLQKQTTVLEEYTGVWKTVSEKNLKRSMVNILLLGHKIFYYWERKRTHPEEDSEPWHLVWSRLWESWANSGKMKTTEENRWRGEERRRLKSGCSCMPRLLEGSTPLGWWAVGGIGMVEANIPCLDAHGREMLEDSWLRGLVFRPQECVSRGFQWAVCHVAVEKNV